MVTESVCRLPHLSKLKCPSEEINSLHSSPNIIRVIKARRLRLTGHVAHMGNRRVQTGFWWGNVQEGGHLEDPALRGRVILKWISDKWDGEHGLDRCGSG